MKHYLFIILFLFPSLLFSQTNAWFSNAQQWYYEYNTTFSSGFEEWTVTGESEINSFNCIAFQSRRNIQDVLTPSYNIDPAGGDIVNHYIYEENDSVYYYNSNDDAFELMYDFNMQIGDKMTVCASNEIGLFGDSIAIEIDSLGVMDMGGNPLRFQRVHLISIENGFENYFEKIYIFEKMGVVNLAQNKRPSHLLLKSALSSYGLFEELWTLRCYDDDDASYHPSGDWCDQLAVGYWLVPGASWCYRKDHLTGLQFSEKNISLVEEVVFPSHSPPVLWKAVQEIRVNYHASTTQEVYLDTFYLYERNAQLFQVSANLSTTKMLYNLHWQAGDIIPISTNESGCEVSNILVDSIRQVEMNAIPLRKLYCTAELDAGNSDLSFPFEITARLGSFDFDINNGLSCVMDNLPYQFVSYSDSQINPNPDNCFSVGVANDEFENLYNIVIAPNPSQHFIHIESDVRIQEIKIMDASGKLVQTVLNDLETLDIHHFPNGIYFLNIRTKNGDIAVEKFVKY